MGVASFQKASNFFTTVVKDILRELSLGPSACIAFSYLQLVLF